jgi:integrase/recombinase XerD
MSSPSLHEAVERFLRYLEAERMAAPETLRWYRSHLRVFAAFAGGLPDPLSPEAFAAFIGGLRRDGRSPHTVAAYVRLLRHFGRFLAEREGLPESPAARLRIPRADRRPRAISREDQRRMLRAARSERDRALLLLLRDTGMRAKELLGLSWRDLDLRRRSAVVRGKGGRHRVVFFSEQAARALRAWRRRSREDRVFPLSYQGLRSLLDAIARRAGVKGPHGPHAWRHAFGLEMARRGMPLFALQRLMGHSSPLVTEIYVRFSGEDLREIYERYAGR